MSSAGVSVAAATTASRITATAPSEMIVRTSGRMNSRPATLTATVIAEKTTVRPDVATVVRTACAIRGSPLAMRAPSSAARMSATSSRNRETTSSP
jgi:hypothetical protein